MSFDAESLQKHIPSYLAEEYQKVLFRELKALSSGSNADYILNPRNDSFRNAALQGDGWRGFQLFEFQNNRTKNKLYHCAEDIKHILSSCKWCIGR
ncbi:MAG: hypothetical protein OXD01_03295 [Gammaproteobacteria bacterium]|nr:hypothetical protein [Gammaproteobacteria bacterium]